MMFLGFGCVCKKVNIFLYFQNKMMLKIKECINASEMCFLWFKLNRGSWFTCLLSREVVVALSAMRMTKHRHDFIMLLDNIHMGITS
jgi:hypothetical protein